MSTMKDVVTLALKDNVFLGKLTSGAPDACEQACVYAGFTLSPATMAALKTAIATPEYGAAGLQYINSVYQAALKTIAEPHWPPPPPWSVAVTDTTTGSTGTKD